MNHKFKKEEFEADMEFVLETCECGQVRKRLRNGNCYYLLPGGKLTQRGTNCPRPGSRGKVVDSNIQPLPAAKPVIPSGPQVFLTQAAIDKRLADLRQKKAANRYPLTEGELKFLLVHTKEDSFQKLFDKKEAEYQAKQAKLSVDFETKLEEALGIIQALYGEGLVSRGKSPVLETAGRFLAANGRDKITISLNFGQ